MDLRKEDLPATLQAYELLDNKEIFIAEQVVNNQSEIDLFTSRYLGKLIKAKSVPSDKHSTYGQTTPVRRNNSGRIIAVVIILIILALVIYGYSTGWLQEKLHLKA